MNKDKKEWERIGWATWNAMRVHVTKGMPSYKKFMSFLYENDAIKKAELDAIKLVMNNAVKKYKDGRT